MIKYEIQNNILGKSFYFNHLDPLKTLTFLNKIININKPKIIIKITCI